MHGIRRTSSSGSQQSASKLSAVADIPLQVQRLLSSVQEENLIQAETICHRLLTLIPLLQTHHPKSGKEYDALLIHSLQTHNQGKLLEFFLSTLKTNTPPYDKKIVDAFSNLIQKILENIEEQIAIKTTKETVHDFAKFIQLLELTTKFNPFIMTQCQSIFAPRCQVLERAAKLKKPPSSSLFGRAAHALTPHEALLTQHRITVETGDRTITCWLFAFYLRASERLQQEKKLDHLSDAAFKVLDEYLNLHQIDWISLSEDTLKEIAPFIRKSDLRFARQERTSALSSHR